MEITGSSSGRAWEPWPELMAGHRPVLVAPSDPARPAHAGEGWGGDNALPQLREDWSAAYDGTRLTVHRLGRAAWYDGPLSAGREWARALRSHRTLLLLTGPFTSPFDFPAAAAEGRLLLLAVPARVVDAHQHPPAA
ncbi:hypothetical protein AB0K51_14485 [Kitasatospora sp. NPDC049285]|uniref:hypothetical protein n=1 Tax=Kitasatospora sp. NPDC049285 TaxID=3157096 RepID=UPI003439FB12